MISDFMMKISALDKLIDPSWYFYGEAKERDECEKSIYEELVSSLENDLKNLEIELNVGSKIIIRNLATKLIMLGRIKIEFVEEEVLRDSEKIKPSEIRKQRRDFSNNSVQQITYSREYGQKEVNPAFELMLKIHKEVKKDLKDLGMLPAQQVERQKLTIIKTLKQKYQKNNLEYGLKATHKMAKSV